MYAVGMLILVIGCILSANKKHEQSRQNAPSIQTVTELVYVYISEESPSSPPIHDEVKRLFWVQEYGEKIGIFSEDGTLLEVLDVYVKTLPKADRDLLEEGFMLFSEEELRAIREDYTS